MIISNMTHTFTISSRIAAVPYLLPKSSFRILDIECKGNSLLPYFQQQRTREFIGVTGVKDQGSSKKLTSPAKDISTGYIHMLELNFEEATELPFPEGYFDCILCLDILPNLANPDQFFSILRKCLSQHGTLILSFPNILHISFILRLLRDGRFKGSLVTSGISDLRFFSLTEVAELMARNGFEIDSNIYGTVSSENTELSEFCNDLSAFVGGTTGHSRYLMSRTVYFALKCRKVDSIELLQQSPLLQNCSFSTFPDDQLVEICIS